MAHGSVRSLDSASKETWWSQHREASLNWLALGLLLAAWNASDNDAGAERRRPQALRGYPCVSVRAAALYSAHLRSSPTPW
jgi:hypothetical protein